MADLASLVVKLEAQTSQYQKELEKAKSQLGKFDRDINAAATKIGKSFGVALSAAAGGVALLVKNSLDAADEIGKMSQKIGIGTEDLSKLAYAAKLADVDMAGLQTGLQQLSKNAVDAADGTGTSAAAFKALGVSVKDTSGQLKDTHTLTLELADAFSKFADGPEKTAAAMAILGKSGADLIPLFNGGAEAINAAGVELEKFGGVITPEAAKNAETFNDNITKLQYASTGFATQLGAQMSPALADITNRLVELTKDSEATKRAAEGVEVVFRGLAGATAVVGNVFQIAGDNIAATAATIAAVARGDFAGAMEIFRARSEDFQTDLNDIITAFDKRPTALADPIKAAGEAAEVAAKKVLNFSAAIKEAKGAKDGEEKEDPIAGLTDKFVDKGSSIFDDGPLPGLDIDNVYEEQRAKYQENQEAMTKLLEEEAQKRRQIEEDAIYGGLNALSDAAFVAETMGKKGFEAFKAFKIAETIIATYEAATKAYASLVGIPVVGPGLAIGAAGAAVAAGLANVAQIRAASPGGYMEGGFTGHGPLDEVAGVVHKGEYVLSNDMLHRLDQMSIGYKGEDFEPAGGDVIIQNYGEPMNVRMSRNGRQMVLEMLPMISDAVEGNISDGVASGLGRLGKTVSDKFGVQGRAAR